MKKQIQLNQLGSYHLSVMVLGLVIVSVLSVGLLVGSNDDQPGRVLSTVDTKTINGDAASKAKGYAVVTRKYKDFDINYAVEKGLNTGMYPLVSDNPPPPCKQIKNEVLNKGRSSRTLWECTPGTWYAVPRDADPNSPISMAYEKGSTKSKYAIKIKIKSGKTVRPKTLVLRKSDL